MRPLRDESEQAARRVAEANRAFEPSPAEQATAWARLRDRVHDEEHRRRGKNARAVDAVELRRRRARRGGLRLLLGAGALATLAAVLLIAARPRPSGSGGANGIATHRPGPSTLPASPAAPVISPPPPLSPPSSSSSSSSSASASATRSRSGMAPVALRPGRSRLAAGVTARLGPKGLAQLLADPPSARPPGAASIGSVIALQRGRLDVDIDGHAGIGGGAAPEGAANRPSGGGADRAPLAGAVELAPAAAPAPAVAGVEVEVAAYRLEADAATAPARFSVSARGERVDVVVRSGKVAVWSSRRLLATVVAGQRWTNPAAASLRRAGVAGDGDGTAPAARAVEIVCPAPALAPPVAEPGPSADAPDCARLTREGDTDGALACFARAAQSPGLTGELALMELARIRRDVKGDVAGAERALADHRRRFPHGALADEATNARVELLLRLGRPAEALSETAHLMGGDAIFWRAVCLARLGRRAEAARAFDDYLARSDGKRRVEAARMRRELGP